MTYQKIFRKGVSALWFDISAFNQQIDKAKAMNSDCVSLFITPEYIEKVKAGGIDYIGNGINYAHSKNIKILLFIALTRYVTNKSDFEFNIDAQNHLLEDWDWIMDRYPTLDGIVHEEWACTGCSADFFTSFFIRQKAIIDIYRAIDLANGIFIWGFNSATNNPSKLTATGYDVAYINSHNLFNSFFPELGITSLSQYQYLINMWTPYFSNLTFYPHTYIRWASLVNAPECAGDLTQPTCYNQAIFNQVQWSQNNNYPVLIFTMGWAYNAPSSRYPNNTIPGANAAEKIAYIWNTPSLPNCDFTWTPSISIINQDITFTSIDLTLTSQIWKVNNIVQATSSSWTGQFTTAGIYNIQHEGTNVNGTCSLTKQITILPTCPYLECDFTIDVI